MKVTVAATQMACSERREDNLARAEAMVRRAAAEGGQVILLQELFETPYFCKDHDYAYLELATSLEENPAVTRLSAVAAELGVVLPVSFFERAGNACFNTVAMIDADGRCLGTYRKAHIPESPGYHEKFYFAPGDTGFRVWSTRYGRIGVGICWDQWFPECARAMALMGAEILCYPTAIGSEPQDPTLDSRPHWQRTMQGHAAANLMPLVASNRIGREVGRANTIDFYGHSFIAGPTGELVEEAGGSEEALLLAAFDLEAVRLQRRNWGMFRDRRPDLYGALLSLDLTDDG
ncbi:MAG: N-carbamoylputrescine amidase [Steroidobacteraceae bacterium]